MVEGFKQRPTKVAERFICYPEALTKVLYAYARLGVAHDELFEAAAPHCMRFLRDRVLKPHDVAQLTWAWATVGPTHVEMHAALDERLQALCDNTSKGRGNG